MESPSFLKTIFPCLLLTLVLLKVSFSNIDLRKQLTDCQKKNQEHEKNLIIIDSLVKKQVLEFKPNRILLFEKGWEYGYAAGMLKKDTLQKQIDVDHLKKHMSW